jgi:recombination protein RecT
MSNLIEYIGQQEHLFLPVLSDESVSWEKEKQFAIQAIQGNDYLAKIATNNQASLQNAIVNIASIGISLNPALKHAYLVPRKGGVCLDLSYMGLLHLAQSSGVILWGQCKVVRANDTYQNTGLSKEPNHLANTFGDRGEIVGAYCTVKTVDGDFLTEEMSIKEIFDIRARSEAFKKGNGPWKTDEGEMIRKTVVKRAYKYWPKCERLGSAIQMLNDNGEGISNEKDVTPFINAEQADQLLPLLCDEMGIYTPKGEKVARAFKFNNLGEIKSTDFEKVLQVAS